MKFEKLSEHKLKITLTSDELPSNNLDLDDLIKDPSLARESFLELLDKAQDEVNFNVGNNRIRIDAKYMQNGNFIFTITKLIPKKSKKLKVKPTKIPINNISNTLIYCFDNIENFFKFCKFLKVHKINNLKSFAQNTQLYNYNNKYYLLFNGINNDYKHISKLYSCMTEFGEFYSSQEIMGLMISERGTLIMKNNAIQISQKNFN